MKHYTLSIKIPDLIQEKIKNKLLLKVKQTELKIEPDMKLILFHALISKEAIEKVFNSLSLATFYLDLSKSELIIEDHILWLEVKANQGQNLCIKKMKEALDQNSISYKDSDFCSRICLAKKVQEAIDVQIPSYHVELHEIDLTHNKKILATSLLKTTTQYVYIIECMDQTFYTGWTNDIKKRYQMHLNGKGAKYTKIHKPNKLVYVETFKDKSSALKREYEIKQLSKAEKSELIKKAYHNNMPEI
ncbi:MAG: GIY-YIG nuclease family protein [Erysipelotrichaceae bacterium]